MLTNFTTTQTTLAAPAQKPGAAQKLEQVRNRVRFALRAAEEGPPTVLPPPTTSRVSDGRHA